jgi:hypothetical protein
VFYTEAKCWLVKINKSLNVRHMQRRDAILDKLLSQRGTARTIADKIGRSIQVVHQWRRVPAQHVIAVEEATGMSRTRLRPDIYPPASLRRREHVSLR